MKKEKVQQSHWMLTDTPEQVKETKKKIVSKSITSLLALALSIGSFSIVAIPNIGTFLSIIGVMSGVSFLAVLTNSLQKAIQLSKELVTDKKSRSCLNKSVESLSKSELEMYNLLFPKAETRRVENKEIQEKAEYLKYCEEIDNFGNIKK